MSSVYSLAASIVEVLRARRGRQKEKSRLELVKLYYEIEAIKAEHKLHTIKLPPGLEPDIDFRVEEAGRVTFVPRLAPRDWLDLMCVTLSAIYLLCVTTLVSGILSSPFVSLVLFAPHAKTRDGVIALVFVYAILWVLTIIFLASDTVFRLQSSNTGLHFVRIFGSPKFLSWKQIESIEPELKRTSILRAWFWPLWRKREASMSVTTIGHCRIVWPGGYYFFAPDDDWSFRQEVASRLLCSRGPNSSSENTKQGDRDIEAARDRNQVDTDPGRAGASVTMGPSE